MTNVEVSSTDRLALLSPSELLTQFFQLQTEARQVRSQTQGDFSIMPAAQMRDFTEALRQSMAVLTEFQRPEEMAGVTGPIFKLSTPAGEKQVSAGYLKELVEADLQRVKQMLPLAEATKDVMGRHIPEWAKIPDILTGDWKRTAKLEASFELLYQGLGLKSEFPGRTKRTLKKLLGQKISSGKPFSFQEFAGLIATILKDPRVRDEIVAREFLSAFGRAPTMTEAGLMDSQVKIHGKITTAIETLAKRGVEKDKGLIGAGDKRRAFLKLATGTAAVVTAGAAASLAGMDFGSSEKAAREQIKDITPSSPGLTTNNQAEDQGEVDRIEAEASEEPPKDLFRDVWLPSLLTWAGERVRQKQASDPEFLARIEPAFLPIDAENRTGRINFLILGEGGEGMLTDVIMVISYDAATNQVDLISLSRDLYAPEVRKRINTTFYLGKKREGNGFGLTEKTIEAATGLPVHFGGYVKMDAVAFLIDNLGGIEVEVSERIETYVPDLASPRHVFEAGRQNLDGSLVLRYVRSRLGSNDIVRQRRQQQVVEAMISKAKTDRSCMLALLKFLFWDIDQQAAAGNLAFDFDLGEARKRIFGMGLETIIPAIQAKFDEGANISLPTVGRHLDLRQADLYETGRVEGDQYLKTVVGAESLSDPVRYWGPVRKWVASELGR